LENPVKAFSFVDGNFEPTYVGTERFDGVACDVVSLRPLSREFGITNIMLYIDPSTSLPRGVKYQIDNSYITVTVKRFERLSSVNNSLFSFDRQDYRGYEIIDFR
jgi:outer membrane lipoprotein-sorting protein